VNRTKLATIVTAVVASFILLVPSIAMAIDWSFTGFIRQEIAVSITDDENENNASTKPNLTRAVPTQGFGQYNPGSSTTSAIGDSATVNVLHPVALRGDPTRPSQEFGVFSASPTTCNFFAGMNNFGFAQNPATLRNATALGVPIGLPTAPTANFINSVAGGAIDPCTGLAPGASQINPRGAAFADESNFNMFNTRAEFDIQANNITDRINAFAKIRVYFDGTSNFNDQLVGSHFDNDKLYGDRGNLMELNSNDVMIDIPSLYFDYNKGPLWLRVGQQQIAWGEALFFRVFDVANGLDLRRHFFLDVASEEYADERVASPGVRLSYTWSNGIEIDAFVQMFSPTVLMGQDTAYNLVTNGFYWDNGQELEEAQNTLNYGMRLTWPVTDSLTVQAMAVNRRNPDGVVRWHDAPQTLKNGAPNPFCAGQAMAQTVAALGDPNLPDVARNFGAGVGADFSSVFGSPFGGNVTLSAQEISLLRGTTALSRTKYTENGCGSFFMPTNVGTNSASTWFQLSANTRFDPTALAAASIDLTQISRLVARQGFGLPTETSPEAIARFGSERAAGVQTLDAFYSNFGALSGWITREFKRETILGVGGNYIFTSENEMLDQLVLRGEMSYTPNKKFTNQASLGANWIEADEYTASIIAEKYHRWSDAVPAMFMVAEWMIKTESDLFGRHLSFMETNPSTDLTGCLNVGAVAAPNRANCNNRPEGSDYFNSVVFAFQQPFPDLIWRLDFAFLMDLEGGWFIQPGVRYRPSAKFQFDVYANIAQDGGNKGDDIVETFDYADEIFARATYFF
jgi:hypothetical protein